MKPTFATPPRIWLKSDKPLARIARNVLWLLSGKGVSAVLSLIYLGLATRTLGVENFGHFALILSMGAAIVQFTQFDLWQVVVRFGAGHMHEHDRRALGKLAGACRVLEIASMLIGCLLAWVTISLFVHFQLWEAATGRTALVYCCVLLLAMRSTPNGVLRLHNRFDLSVYGDTIVSVVRMIGTVVVLLVRPDVIGFLIAWGTSELCASIAVWVLAWWVDREAMAVRHSLDFFRTLREQPGLPRFLLVTNLGTTLSGLAAQIPLLALGSFVGPAAAGLFRLASQLTQALSKITSLIGRSAYAEMNHVRARGGLAALSKVLRRAKRLAIGAGAALMLFIALLGEPLLLLVAGKAFVGAYPLLLLLGGAAAVNLVGVTYEPALLAATDGIAVLRLRILTTIIYLALVAVALPLWGAMGTAGAAIVANLLTLMIFEWALNRHIHNPASKATEAPAPDQA